MSRQGLRALSLLGASLALAALLLLVFLASTLAHATPVHAVALPAELADAPDVVITKTVGIGTTGCATESSIVVPLSTTVYFCLTMRNTGNLTITSQTLDDPLIGKFVISQSLAPSQTLVLTNESHAPLDPALSFTKTITTDLSSSVTLTATFSNTTTPIVKVATATVALSRASATLKKTVGLAPNVCASTTSQAVAAGTVVYYCLTIQNTGNITLLHHTVGDPLLGFTNQALADYSLKPSASLTVTTSQLPALASTFPGTTDITNTAFYTGMDTSNQLTVHAQAQAKAEIARATIALTTTVGVNSAACGAYDTIGVSP
ncbi:MAG: hypothetical protein NT075_13730, partial [Chloroflexi bacterium]|nr:hypothetical protein [Chloroflexota bacterium]